MYEDIKVEILSAHFYFNVFVHLQSNFNGSNIFWTIEICSRYG